MPFSEFDKLVAEAKLSKYDCVCSAGGDEATININDPDKALVIIRKFCLQVNRIFITLADGRRIIGGLHDGQHRCTLVDLTRKTACVDAALQLQVDALLAFEIDSFITRVRNQNPKAGQKNIVWRIWSKPKSE